MRPSGKSAPHLEKKCGTEKCGYLENYTTPKKSRHTWKSAPH